MINIIKKLFVKILNVKFYTHGDMVAYLCSGQALPKALKPEEEQKYVRMLDSGNEYAKQKLIEHNLRLVIYIAKRFENTDAEIEDLISIGSIGLIKAINSYKSDKNIKIATYASKCIENEILMHLRKISKQKQEVSFDEPLSTDGEGNELVLSDILPSDTDSPQNDFEQSATKKILWSVLNNMNPREQEIMLMRFGLNGGVEQTQKEVADALGISQSYISRLEKKIVQRIKKEMHKLA